MGKLFNAYVSSYRMDTKDWDEYLEVAGDIYTSPQVQKLDGFVQHFNITRLQHIRSVAFLSFLVSRKLGLNYKDTARAATSIAPIRACGVFRNLILAIVDSTMPIMTPIASVPIKIWAARSNAESPKIGIKRSTKNAAISSSFKAAA